MKKDGETMAGAVGRAYRLGDSEKRDCRKLWEEIFTEDSGRFLDYYDQWKYTENECYGIRDGDRLVSMVQLNPYELQIGGGCPEPVPVHRRPGGRKEPVFQTVSSCYIIAVATRKEYRHQGMMSRLLKESLSLMRVKKMPFVFLMPAAEAIYYPFGFRYFYEANTGTLNFRQAPGAEGNIGIFGQGPGGGEETGAFGEVSGGEEGIEPFRRMDGSRELSARLATHLDLEALAAFSEKVQSELFECYTKRDIHYYEMLLAELESEGGGLLLLTEPEAAWQREKDGKAAKVPEKASGIVALVPYWGSAPVEVREILCRPCEKERVLSALSRWFTDGTEGKKPAEVSMTGAAFELESKKPVIMGRIVDAVSFLELFGAERPMELLLELSDDFLEENSGFYHWSLSPEGSVVKRDTSLESRPLRAAQIGNGGKEEAEGRGLPRDFSEPEMIRFTAPELFSALMGGEAPKGALRGVRACRSVYINEIV